MQTLREQYDTIYNSIINGQRKQAVSQMTEMGLCEIPDMLEYFTVDLNQPEIALDAAKSYFRITAQ